MTREEMRKKVRLLRRQEGRGDFLLVISLLWWRLDQLLQYTNISFHPNFLSSLPFFGGLGADPMP